MKYLFFTIICCFSFFVKAQNLKKIDSLKKIYTNTQAHDTLRVNALTSVLNEYIFQDKDSATHYLKKLYNYATKNNSDWGFTKAYYNNGNFLAYQKKFDSALYFYKKALHYSRLVKDPEFEASCHLRIASAYTNLLKMDSAIMHNKTALVLALQVNNVNQQGDVYVNLGQLSYREEYYDNALYYFQKADSIYTANKLRNMNLSNAFYSIAQIHFNQKNYDKSISYFNKVKQLYKELGFNLGVEVVNFRLGSIDLETKNYSQAISKLNKTLRYFKEKNNLRFIAESSTSLGIAYTRTHKLTKAIALTKTADSIYTSMKDSLGLKNTKLALSAAYFENRNLLKSETYANQALKISQKIKNIEGQQNAYSQLAAIETKKQNYKLANSYLIKANRYKDSLTARTNKKNLQNLEAVYHFNKNKQKIALLESKNQLAEQQKKNQQILLLSGIGLTSLVSLFFFFQYRNRQKTNTKLKELDKAKSTFFSNISHEFRTPLTLIKGPIEDQLASKNLSPIHRKNLITAKQNANRLENLVDQLLALSKLESGKIKLQVQATNISSFCAAQANAFEYLAHEKNIRYKIAFNKDNQTDWFDHDALQKILCNLIGNALKYTPENETITVSGKRDKNSYIINVHNTGSYLNPEQQTQIFTRFYQTSVHNSGTGIGLALSKELAELHKGTITVKSSTDKGTTFTLTIPVNKENYTASQLLSEKLIPTQNEAQPTTTLNIEAVTFTPEEAPTLLIVEDNAEIRHYIVSIFENQFKILETKNGQEGYDKAIETIPDIIISDVMMPILNGIEFTNKIKQHELTTHIPVILLTAKTQDKDKLEGVTTGADAYITKPFSSSFLVATVNNLLDNRKKIQQRFAKEVVLIPSKTDGSSADACFLEKLKEVLDEYLTNPQFNIETFSTKMGISRMQLHRKLKAITGQTTSEFIKSYRLQLAAKIIKEKSVTVSEVGYAVGFNDPSYFTKCFKQEFGCSPKEY